MSSNSKISGGLLGRVGRGLGRIWQGAARLDKRMYGWMQRHARWAAWIVRWSTRLVVLAVFAVLVVRWGLPILGVLFLIALLGGSGAGQTSSVRAASGDEEYGLKYDPYDPYDSYGNLYNLHNKYQKTKW